MRNLPKVGTTGEIRFTVETRHAIDFAEGGMPAVLSTPQLIGLLERTARQTLAPFLDENERSVGIEIELRHLAPTGVGSEVVCLARVIGAEHRSVAFQLEARDGQELIARGHHRRSVVRVESFARRLAAKSKAR